MIIWKTHPTLVNVEYLGTVKDEEVYIHYHWTSKEMNGGYIYFSTTPEHVKVEIFEAKNDSVLYETFIQPRK